jgi:hypothetical protein
VTSGSDVETVRQAGPTTATSTAPVATATPAIPAAEPSFQASLLI